MSPGNDQRRPADRGTGYQVTGRVSLNLMVPRGEAMHQAGQVESLPASVTVILRVAGLPDPAVVDRLRTFGKHCRFEVHGRDGASTAAWIGALRDGMGWH